MQNLIELRTAAREIFAETLRAVDPFEALVKQVSIRGSVLKAGEDATDLAGRNIYSVAIGKAAVRMAAALDKVLGSRLSAGVVSSNAAGFAQTQLSSQWQRFDGGHPAPNEESLAAARAAVAMLERANEESALVIFLISGGGSAMIELPVNEDISIADLNAANRVLVDCGASIAEINS